MDEIEEWLKNFECGCVSAAIQGDINASDYLKLFDLVRLYRMTVICVAPRGAHKQCEAKAKEIIGE